MRMGSIPAMRVRYILESSLYHGRNNRFNSRYAGKIHLGVGVFDLHALQVGSIPAMRVRYIKYVVQCRKVMGVVQFPLCG